MPTLTGFAPSISFAENTVNAAPQLLDADVVFTDAEGDFNGGTLTLSGLLAEDTVSVRNEGSGAGQIGLSGANVTYGGVVIGTLAGGAGAPLTITFNAAATSVAIDALIQNLTYANSSDSPTETRTLAIEVTDAAGNDLSPPSFTQGSGADNPFYSFVVPSHSRPTFGDLDSDGDLDALVGDLYGWLTYFENTGTASAPVFPPYFGTANPLDFVRMGFNSAPAFADLDGDGDLDALVGEGVGFLSYFENTGTALAPVFVQQTGADNPFDGVDVGSKSTPVFADLDGDGDLDALVGEYDGTLSYFENTGTALAPVFVQQTGVDNPFDGVDVGRYSTPTFADLDGDGDLDAVVGEFYGILHYYENTGTASAPVFVQQTGADDPFNGVDVGNFSAPTFADLDGDGDLDALVGDGVGGFTYLENTTAPPSITVTVDAEIDAPTLTGFDPSVILGENTVNATPQLLDADVVFTDSDGDFDGGFLTVSGLLAEDTVSVRNEGTGAGQIGLSGANVTYGGVVIGTLAGGAGAPLTITFNAAATSVAIDALIQNLTYANSSDAPTASRDLTLNVTDAAGNDLSGDPVFALQTGTDNPFNGVDVGRYSAPTFVDLDGDGDLDALVGEFYGSLHYFENTGTASAPMFVEQTGADNPFNGVDVDFKSRPTFADLDDDGDMDALVGDRLGPLRYYENTGTAAAPVFVLQTGADNPFDGAVVGFASPTFADLDDDGDLDALVGEVLGALLYYENTGTASAPVFVQQARTANPFNGVDVGLHSTPVFADLDGDGDLDALVGESYGTLLYFENVTVPPPSITVTVNAENDAPTLTGVANSVTFLENTVNATPQLIDSDVTFGDVDGSFAGGSLTVTGLLAQDRVSIRNQGNTAGLVGLSAGTLTYGGVTIGTVSGGAGGTLTISFNASATAEAVDAVIQNLTYANSSDTPTASRVLTITATDGGGLATDAAEVTVNVTAEADIITINGSTGNDTLTGTAGADQLNGRDGADILSAGDGDDRLDGGRGADTLNGGQGADFLNGGADNDRLDGGVGNDTLKGGSGNDILIGGAGDDLLDSGSGSDIFLFNAGLFGADTIVDFGNGLDRIQFSGIAGVDDFTDLVITAVAGGVLITLPDGSSITIEGMIVAQTDASDFIFGP